MSEQTGTSGNGTSAAESMRMGYSHARDAAKQVIGQARERASDYYDQGKERATQYEKQMEHFVREQPVKSVLIAAGVGLLVGYLLRR